MHRGARTTEGVAGSGSGEPGAHLREGDVLAGKWRVERELGRGGMSVVVEATHVTFGDRVALKLLLPERADRSSARLMREAQAMRAIESEHVAKVKDVEVLADGTACLVMERLEGETVAAKIAAGPLPIGEVDRIAIAVAEALRAAHAAGIVHRDLKPSNVFVCSDGAVKVLDFGVAKALAAGQTNALTVTSAVVGSPAYMSPEQVRDARRAEAQSDVWSFGVMLFEMLSGELPFVADSPTGLAVRIATEPPRSLAALRPDVTPRLCGLVDRCLQKREDDRPQGALALLAALRSERPPRSPARIALAVSAVLFAVSLLLVPSLWRKRVGASWQERVEALASSAHPVEKHEATAPESVAVTTAALKPVLPARGHGRPSPASSAAPSARDISTEDRATAHRK